MEQAILRNFASRSWRSSEHVDPVFDFADRTAVTFFNTAIQHCHSQRPDDRNQGGSDDKRLKTW
jgi:hypothetical protein